MIDLPTYPLRIFFIVALLITLAGGVWLAKNQERLFGKDPTMKIETSGEQLYSKTQMWICWVLAVKVLATLIFLL